MSEPLWSNERIQQEAASVFWSGRREPNVRKCAALLEKMRDECEALLPDSDTRAALHRLLSFTEGEHDTQSPMNEDIGRVLHWLQRLERP